MTTKSARRGKRLAWILVLSIPVLLFLHGYFIRPHFCVHDYMECDSNMRKIWLGLQTYAEGHDGDYPERLENLHPTYVDLTTIRCPMSQAAGDTIETGYEYITGLTNDNSKAPVLFCKRYHINGHAGGPYVAQFNVLLNDYSIVHVRDKDLRKYSGPMRRYFLIFGKVPYDGSTPTLELVRSLEDEFHEGHRTIRVDDAKKGEPR